MKTTIDLPLEIVRALKLHTVHQGRKLKDTALEILREQVTPGGVHTSAPSPDFAARARARAIWGARQKGGSFSKAVLAEREPSKGRASIFEMSRDLFDDMGSGGPRDLSTGPRYLEDFGR